MGEDSFIKDKGTSPIRRAELSLPSIEHITGRLKLFYSDFSKLDCRDYWEHKLLLTELEGIQRQIDSYYKDCVLEFRKIIEQVDAG